MNPTTQYYGRPCKHGHGLPEGRCLRWKCNWTCVECTQAVGGERRAKTVDERRAYQKEYCITNAPAARARAGKQYQDTLLPTPLVWLYEFWSANHECLYVGKTSSLRYRMAQHRRSGSKAYAEHAYTVLNMAVDPEVALIQERRPLYNQRHNGAAA